jgi:hypothetical protein
MLIQLNVLINILINTVTSILKSQFIELNHSTRNKYDNNKG